MNRIHLKAGEFEFPQSRYIGPTYVKSKSLIFESNIDFDINVTFKYSDTNDITKAVTLKDCAGLPISVIIPANNLSDISIDDFYGRYLFMTFTSPAGIAKPSSSGEASSNIDQLNASIAFDVNAGGSAVFKVAVEFGQMIEDEIVYDQVEFIEGIIANTEVAAPVATILQGLTPGITYYWRTVLTNAMGTTIGQQQTFNTLGVALPGIVDEASGAITANSAEVSLNIHPGGALTNAVIQYGLDNTYGSGKQIDPIPAGIEEVPVTVQLTGLQPNTTYHWRVVAQNSAGVEEGDDQTFTTLAQ